MAIQYGNKVPHQSASVMIVESKLGISHALVIEEARFRTHRHHNRNDPHVDLEDHVQRVHLAGHRNID